MSRGLLLALVGSLILHLLTLFGPALPLPGTVAPPPALLAELHPLPEAAGAPPAPAAAARTTKHRHRLAAAAPSAMPEVGQSGPTVVTEPPVDAASSVEASNSPEVVPAPPPPVQPVLASQGTLRYVVYKGTQKFEIGRAEQRWDFPGDGTYRLYSMTETSGLVALFKPVKVEYESRGRLVAGGLQPDRFIARKDGVETDERVDFDWAAGQVLLARDASQHPLAAGSQDILSLNYQLVYLGSFVQETEIAVATGRKYARYRLSSLGEEELETPLGMFRTLHLRAATDTVTEIWIALDHHRLPVKIRFTDKKGDIYEQVVTEMGREQPAPT